MKTTLTLLSFLFLLSSTLYSKDIIELYTKHLPKEITNNKYYIKAENIKLEKYAKLNPDLLNLYISHLNLKFNDKISNPDSNLTYIFKFMLDDSRIRKNYWAEKNIKIINEANYPYMKRREVTKYFQDYLVEESRIKSVKYSIKMDKNKAEYIKYIYYARTYDEEYSEDVNYSEKNKLEISALVEYFNQKFNIYSDLSSSEKEKLKNDAEQYSFLFKDSYLDDYTKTTDFSYLELMEKFYTPRLNDKFYVDFGAVRDLLEYGERKTLKFEDPFGQQFTYDIDLTAKNVLFVKLGFMFRFRDENVVFSYLNFKLGYSVSESLSNPKDKQLWNGLKAIPGLWVSGRLFMENVKINESSFISSQINFPVIYLFENIFVEAGLNYTFSSMTYSYNLFFEGTIHSSYDGSIPDLYKERPIEIEKKSHLFFPLLSINYIPRDWVIFNADYLFSKNIQFGLTLRY